MRLIFRSLLLFLLVGLTACGFQLRGAYTLPYSSLYISGSDYSLIIANLKRAVKASGTTLASSVQEAQAIFLPVNEIREPVILSLSSAGRVREKRLRYLYAYRIVDAKGRNLLAPGTVELFRDLTYADSDVLAKTQEEELLWRDMESDLVQQLMRRLAAAKPLPVSEEE